MDLSPTQPGDGQPAKPRGGVRRQSAPFWRACRFMWPHRALVAVSVCCALFVGAAFTGGMSTMLPIIRVLVENDTVPNWTNRKIAERRLKATLSDDLRLLKLEPGSPLAAAGFQRADVLTSPTGDPAEDLRALSNPDVTSITLAGQDGIARPVELPAVPGYLAVVRHLAGYVPADPVYAIATIFVVILCLATVGNTARFFQEYLSDKVAILTVNDIRRKLYDHVLHMPMAFFSLRGSTDVTSRLVQDAQGLENGFKTVLGQSIQEPIRATMFLGLAFYLDWRLTLFIIVFAPVMVVIIRKFGKKMRRASRKALQNSSEMLGQIDATLQGIRVVKSANAERLERRRYTRIMDQLVEQQKRMSRIDAFAAPTMETLTLLVFGVVLLFAAYLMFKVSQPYQLNVEIFFAVMGCLVVIGESLRRLGKVNNVLSKASAAAGRIFEILEVPVEKPRALASASGSSSSARPRSGATPLRKLPVMSRDIVFEDVTFAYPGASSPAVENVSLVVPRGRCVAIVGRNGSGKTTLLSLLPRFYDPQAGRILIDGVDIRTATLRSLRRQISIVTQDSVIFPGTIAQNIAYGDSSVYRRDGIDPETRQRIIEAAKRAFAHDFIMEKPDGYDTVLGGLGSSLSGGQKQRLCIARAIYRNAPILILDEATSQVDAESEHLIQQAIESVMHERTTFVIAHRFSTILSADTIVVMDRGRVVAQGRHEELLASSEVYQQLSERQLIPSPV